MNHDTSRFQVPTLQQIFWGPLANGFRRIAQRRKQGVVRQSRAYARRVMKFETLEPRLLLSADSVLGGSPDALLDGLTAVSDEIGSLIADDMQLDSYVPGVLVVRGSGDDAVEISPTLQEALNIPVDVNGNGLDATITALATPYAGGDSLIARYQYVRSANAILDVFDPSGTLRAEAALRVVDLDGDLLVSMEEAFKVLVVGQISDYVASTTIGNQDGDGDVDVQDLALQVEDFLDGGLFFGFGEPGTVEDFLDIDVDAVSGSFNGDTGTLGWAMDFSLTMVSKERFDLGYEADQLSIALDPADPLNNPGVAATPTKVDLRRTIDFDSFIFGLRDADAGPVASSDFFFAVPGANNMSLGVSFVDPTGSNDLNGANINIGFLGATVTVGTATLDMDVLGTAVDPSNPDALGFSLAQQGVAQPSGTLLAADTPEFADLDATDIEFTLRVGNGVLALPVMITLDDLAANDDAGQVATSLNSAIGTASADLGAIVTAINDGGRIRLTLDASNAIPLGFASNEVGGGFGQTVLTASNVSSLVGQAAAGQQFSFLLGLGGRVPKLVTVTGILNDPNGPDGLSGDAATDADNNTISAATLRDAANNALAVFGGEVTASVVGAGANRMLRLDGTGEVLEITHTLTLDTVEQITIAELGLGQVLEVAPDPSASFHADLAITAKAGLVNASDDSAYAPMGTVKADIDPFDDVDAVTVDDGVKRAIFELTDTDGDPLKGGASDMQTMLDFNVIGPADILGILNQLANFAERLGGTDLLQAFDLPFGESTLADLLNFKDLIQDTLLIDDLDDGPTKSGAEEDIARLLEWIGPLGKEKLVARFGTAQQLETRLTNIGIGSVNARVKTYDGGKQDLLYDIQVSDNIMPLDTAIQVPIDFALDLDPFAEFEVSGNIAVAADGEFGFTVGIRLGNAVEALDIVDTDPGTGTNLLDDLNSGVGITVNDNPAVSTIATIEAVTGRLVTIDPIIGRLSAEATFTVTTFAGAGNTPTEYTVKVTKGATALNRTAADLRDDINAALAAATVNGVTTSLAGKIVAELEPLIGTANTARIVLRATDASINSFQTNALSNNTAYTELGFGPKRAATVSVLAPLTVAAGNPTDSTPASPGVPVSFTLDFTFADGSTLNVPVTVPLSATLDNVALESLIADINAQLDTSVVVASQSGGAIAFSAVSDEVRFFELTPGTNAELIGLGTDPLLAGVTLRGGASPADPFGRLALNVALDINGVGVTVFKDDDPANTNTSDASDNTSIDDLVDDINTAIAATTLSGKIEAYNDAYRVALRAIDADVGRIALGGLSDAERDALGLVNGSSTGGTSTRPDLKVVSSLAAPVSYGAGTNTSFGISINGGTPVTAMLAAENTILNRSLYDLAASLNTAMNTAFLGQANNPLVATVQAGQIVIGVRTAATGTNLIGDPHPPFPDVASFAISASGSGAAATDLKLVPTGAGMQFNSSNGHDFVIIFSDGSRQGITLDTIAGVTVDSNNKLNGSLASLVAGIVAQATAAKLEITVGGDGTSLNLRDKTGGVANEFRVISVNGSPAALQLGILGKDTSNLSLNEVAAGSLAPDTIIEGARIATVDLLERAYLSNAGFTASLTVTTPEAISAEATFGFVGVNVSTTAGQTLFEADVDIPFLNDEVTLDTLFEALDDDDVQALLAEVGAPTLSVGATDSFELGIALIADPSGDLPAINLGDAKIRVNLPTSLGALGIVMVDPDDSGPLPQRPDLQLTSLPVPTVDFDIAGFDLGELANFDSIDFDSVIDALQAVSGFLNQFATFGFLDDDIPGLGLSVNDLLDVADRFAQAVDDIQSNPSGGLQALGQKIREAFGLPNLSNPADLAAFFANLGIPDATKLIQFALDGADVLRFDLRLPVGFTGGLSVDLDLGDVPFLTGPLAVDLQGGAGLSATGYLDARLSFGIDLDDPTQVYVYDDDTGVFGHLGASARNIAFNAAIGPVGVFVKDGRVDLALDFNLDNGDETPDGSKVLVGVFVQDVINGTIAPELTGTVEATLPVYVPTDSDYIGDIELDISGLNAITLDLANGLQLPDLGDVLTLPDFSSIDPSDFNPFNSIPQMLDALDFFLQGLQDVMSGEVFGIELPFIGDQLQGGADFIEDLRQDVLGPIRQYVEQAPELGQELVQALLFELLAAPAAQGTVGGMSVESIIGISGDIQGVGLLKDYLTGSINAMNISQADIVASNVGTSDFLWKFRLGQTFSPTVPIDFDLGIPALSLEADAELQITLDWDLATGIGVGTAEGAYIYIGDQRTPGADDDDEVTLTIDVDVANGSSITGTLGFLQLSITEDGFNDNDDGFPDTTATAGLENPVRGTYFHGVFGVDLQNSVNAADQKLSFAELGGLTADIDIGAEAEVNLKAVAEFSPAIVPDAIAALLPSVQARFVLDWETGDITSGDFDFGASLNLVGFREVEIDMGSFISDFLGPFVSKIAEVTEPLQPIIDVITAPIPVLSDLAGQPITLVDIAGMTGYVEPAMIYAIADIISFVNKIGDASEYGEFLVPLGDFMIIDADAADPDYLSGGDLLQPGFKLSDAPQFDKDNIAGFLAATQGALAGFGDLLNDGTGDTDSKDLVSGLTTGSEAASSGFAFPLFDDPSLIFGLLLGQDIPLVTYDLAPFGMEFTYVQKFPIWGPLFARISGSVGLTIDLAFGYDTAGVREFAEGDFSNPLDLLAGLYVSDTDQPTGLGTDVPELILKGEIFAGAELNLGVASAGAEGGIILTVNFDLYDPDHDGRVRVDELLGNFLYELNYGSPALAPLAIFDVFGDVSAQLRAFIEVLFFKKTFDITPPITLVEFTVPFEREPFLATERKDGSLLLNLGPSAGQRLNGDTRDIGETVYVRSVSDTEVLVWNGTTVRQSDAQRYEIGANGVIVGIGGAGNDTIDLSRVTHDIRYELEGGEGDDVLLGTQAGGKMSGGLGNDTLTGGDSVDLIFGGEGNDTIDGNDAGEAAAGGVVTGGDADIIFGDTGVFNAAVAAEPNRYRSFVGSKDGDDKIFGRGGNDIIFGGGGIDVIEGNDGNDVILGDGGSFELPANNALPTLPGGDIDLAKFNSFGAGAMDFIYGNAGNDLLLGGAGNDQMDGGADIDTMDGGAGFDAMYGGSGADLMYGGANDDAMFGFRDPQGAAFGFAGEVGDVAADGIDRMFGDEGNDLMRGQVDNDIMRGGRGADIMFGDEDDDEMYGEAGADIIFGGADNDTVDAGDGADIVFGDDGLVVYIDFKPGAADFNFLGSRLRYLDGDQLVGDGSVTLIPAGMLNDLGPDTADDLATSQDVIVTAPLITDGSDTISGGDGKDIVFGGGSSVGVGHDTLFGDYDPAAGFSGPRPTGQDILIGDGGRIELTGRRNELATAVSNPLDGIDHITGNDSGDYIFGGGNEDVIFGFADAAAFPGGASAADRAPLEELPDNDVILGDNGEIHFNPGEVANRIVFITTTWVPGDSGRSDVVDGDFDNDIVLGGLNSSADVLSGDVGQDIILGDQGAIYFDDDPATLEDEGDGDLDTLDLIRSFDDGIGGGDIISGDAANDILIGGTAGDVMYGDNAAASSGASDGEDIMLGDNADIFLIGTQGRLLVQVAAMPAANAVDFITTTDSVETTGGADTMSGNAKADIMLGGVNDGGQDTMYGDAQTAVPGLDGDDILLGDNGELDFTFEADTDRNTLDLIRSHEDGRGGVDVISGNKGLDVAIGGTAGDHIYGDDAAASAADEDLSDLLLGDNADVFLVDPEGAAGGDIKLVLDAAVFLIRTTDEEHPEYGGSDTISGNAAGDIIAGGVQGDTLYGDRSVTNATTSGDDGDDIILGDNGAFEWLSTGRLGEITGIDIAENNPDLNEKYVDGDADTDLTTLDLITTEQPNNGGRDTIYGDEANDIAFGGTDLDWIHGDDGDESAETAFANRDVLFGDHGRLYPQFPRFRLPNSGDFVAADFHSRNFFAIDVENDNGGEGDLMWGEEGHDVMLGQQGDDRMWGGSGDDDMIGGHNVSGGRDELSLPAVQATLNPAMNDLMDGGSGDDAMAGDNAIIWRRGDDVSPRFRTLTEEAIYTTGPDGVDTITTNVGTLHQSDPDDAVGRDIELLDHADTTSAGLFGADVMAGGADSDVMFGQLADDLMQGDGNIGAADAYAQFITRHVAVADMPSNETTEDLYFNIPELGTDADDYMEGNGGGDLMYGGIGQDDMIGGSSALFGLGASETLRPDGSDIIYGGAGAPARLVRNDFVGATDTDEGTAVGVGGVPTDDDPSIALEGRHSRDADFIMGDNANVFRLVGAGDAFLEFNYDQSSTFEDRGDERIVVRALQQLDYTLGGSDYAGGAYVGGAAQPLDEPVDNGAGDLIHGESGDDYIFGMTGSDVIFGESDDDDIVGGYGNDWISGGTGQDGVIGDDGLVYTSRNSEAGEPLYGIEGLLESDANAKYNNGDALNEVISTPGDIQYAVINVEGQLKKTADLVPFSMDPAWLGMDDEFPDDASNVPFADDIVFGGLGSDFLHGGSGDDAISGAEALEHAYVPTFDGEGNANGVLDLGYNAFDLPDPVNPGATTANPNPGNVLSFNPVDLDGQHLNNRFRAGEFFLYDEYDPLRKIQLNSLGGLWKPGDVDPNLDPAAPYEFLLNFDQTEGVFRMGGMTPGNQNQSEPYDPVNDDGKDAIFGDLGNDWLVGGTGRDNVYGGWGNDLINADDDQTTPGDEPKHGGALTPDANDVPDTHPYYEDRAYGGAGRDILIGNTGGDRLIDWVGEYNSYLVPYAPFGQASVSRTMMPHLHEFLYALSAGDGADPTRYADAIGGEPPAPTNNDPIPSRNGEPFGELGLVLQQDFAWGDQTGAPADPQAGNIPGGKRDVLRSASMNDGTLSGFAVDTGTFIVANAKLSVSAESLGLDATAVLPLDDQLPSYYELLATVLVEKPTAGWKANSYIVFDYFDEHDFKFAGINISTNKVEIGYRDDSGWHIVKDAPKQLKGDTFYNLMLAINGTNVTLVIDNKVVLNYSFAPRVISGEDYGLNLGLVGIGSDNSRGTFDNFTVQRVPPAYTLQQAEDFASGTGTLFDGLATGWWTLAGGHYAASGPAVTLVDLDIGRGLQTDAILELSATLSTNGAGGFVFDRYAEDDYKFVTIDAAADAVTIGHVSPRGGLTVDASFARTIDAGPDYTLTLRLKGTSASVSLGGQMAGGYVFNAVTVDGDFGLLAGQGATSFDAATVKTSDSAFQAPETALFAAAPGASQADATLTQTDLDSAATVAISQWAAALGEGDPRLAVLGDARFAVADLAASGLGHTNGHTVLIDADAAGHGWGAMDLATVVTHELGHLLGFGHDDASANPVMRDTLDAGMRYPLDAGTHYALDAGAWAPAAQPAAHAHGAPMIDFGPSIAIDWQAGSSDGWAVKLSPYAPDKPAKSAAANFTGFKVQLLDKPKPFDSLGRALLGKDQGR